MLQRCIHLIYSLRSRSVVNQFHCVLSNTLNYILQLGLCEPTVSLPAFSRFFTNITKSVRFLQDQC